MGKITTRGEVDKVLVKQILQWISHDGDLNRQQYQPILKNLTLKYARGTYDHKKAVKLWMYLVPNAIERYHGKPYVFAKPKQRHMYAAKMVSLNTRLIIARILEKEEYKNIVKGEYADTLPKKYKKNPKKRRTYRRRR